jgi:TRAP-type C4-dicarboxylate transport system substrate-binding protein
MKKIRIFTLIALIVVAFLLPTISCVKTTGPIEISYVTFVKPTHSSTLILQKMFAEVEDKMQGKVKFVYRGGPESINMFAQGSACSKGAVDMVFTTPSFMGKMAKGTETLILCQVPVAEQRECGLYDYLNTVYNEVSLQFIMMYPREMGTAFTIMSKKPITRLADFKGLTGPGGDWFDDAAKTLGVSVTGIKISEEYTALERGVIDFARLTTDSFVEFRIFELAKYMLDVPYGSAPNSLFMNLDKWNAIPEDVRDMLLNTLYGLVPQVQEETMKSVNACMDEMKADGVQMTTLSPEEKTTYLDIMEKSIYTYVSKEAPEVAKKIYDLSRNK